MNSYEGVFIFPPDIPPDARKLQLKSLEDLFLKAGAEIVQKMEWGKKTLGYPINKFNEGHYLIIDYKMDPAKTVEFRKTVELQDSIIKYMITSRDFEAEKKAADARAKETRVAVPAAPAAAPH